MPSIKYFDSASNEDFIALFRGKKVAHIKGFASGIKEDPKEEMIETLLDFDLIVFDGDDLQRESYTWILKHIQTKIEKTPSNDSSSISSSSSSSNSSSTAATVTVATGSTSSGGHSEDATGTRSMPLLIAYKLCKSKESFEQSWSSAGFTISCYLVSDEEAALASSHLHVPAEAEKWDAANELQGFTISDGKDCRMEAERIAREGKYLALGRYALLRTIESEAGHRAVFVWGGHWVCVRELMLHQLKDAKKLPWTYYHSKREKDGDGIIGKLKGVIAFLTRNY